MELVLALDLKEGLVVHGAGGRRAEYRPLDWGISPSAEPLPYVRALSPRSVYIADLDRIAGTGNHDRTVQSIAALCGRTYVDRGCRSPRDFLSGVINVVGTETGGPDLAKYRGGYLSVDVIGGKTVPAGEDPVAVLSKANGWHFSGCILLNIGSVGTRSGVDPDLIGTFRKAYHGKLLYGGGVAGMGDLDELAKAGFDGAIVSTAVHRGDIPPGLIREGTYARDH